MSAPVAASIEVNGAADGTVSFGEQSVVVEDAQLATAAKTASSNGKAAEVLMDRS